MSRQIVLDTETTGIEVSAGNRVIEIGCVELVGRRLTGNHYHVYLHPDREIEEGALEVHGISLDFLADKPRFREVAERFLDFVRDGELIIHNAPFDVGFLDNELRLWAEEQGVAPVKLREICSVTDTLVMARRMHPGQKNNLDALCKRYNVNNEHRDLHGALLDAEILADVYLAMTGGQIDLALSAEEATSRTGEVGEIRRVETSRPPLRVIRADADENEAHAQRLVALDKAAGGACLWRRYESANEPCEGGTSQ